MFCPLEEPVLHELADRMLSELEERALKKGIVLSHTEQAVQALCQMYDEKAGVRSLKHAVERIVTKQLAQQLLENPEEKNYVLSVCEKELKVTPETPEQEMLCSG